MWRVWWCRGDRFLLFGFCGCHCASKTLLHVNDCFKVSLNGVLLYLKVSSALVTPLTFHLSNFNFSEVSMYHPVTVQCSVGSMCFFEFPRNTQWRHMLVYSIPYARMLYLSWNIDIFLKRLCKEIYLLQADLYCECCTLVCDWCCFIYQN